MEQKLLDHEIACESKQTGKLMHVSVEYYENNKADLKTVDTAENTKKRIAGIKEKREEVRADMKKKAEADLEKRKKEEARKTR